LKFQLIILNDAQVWPPITSKSTPSDVIKSSRFWNFKFIPNWWNMYVMHKIWIRILFLINFLIIWVTWKPTQIAWVTKNYEIRLEMKFKVSIFQGLDQFHLLSMTHWLWLIDHDSVFRRILPLVDHCQFWMQNILSKISNSNMI